MLSRIFILTLVSIAWQSVYTKCELVNNDSTSSVESDQDSYEKLTVSKIIEGCDNSDNDRDNTDDTTPKRYDGAQLWRIPIYEKDNRVKIKELSEKHGCQIWQDFDNNIDILLESNSLQDTERLLNTSNIPHVVIIDDLQKAIDEENPPPEEIEKLQLRTGHRMTWKAYHRVADIHDYLNYLAQTYPDLCSVETIGYSAQNRPLLLLKISNKEPGNSRVWIDGGIHAREWISPASATYVIERLAQSWETLPSHMKNIDWYILPVLNPDGYEYTHQGDRLWRKNRNTAGGSSTCPGVDLNRNWGHKWGGEGASADPCSAIYRGKKAFSEPETAAVENYMMKFGKAYFKGYVSIHSYSQYILLPWGYTTVVPSDYNDLRSVGREAAANMLRFGGARYTVGSSAIALYPAAGGSIDWAKDVMNIKYSYTLEMRDTGRYGFILPASQIEINGLETMAFIDTLAIAVLKI